MQWQDRRDLCLFTCADTASVNNATHGRLHRTGYLPWLRFALPKMPQAKACSGPARAYLAARRQHERCFLDTQIEVQRILDEVLSLRGRAMSFDVGTPLLGAIPELDSMAVVTLLTTIEDRFGIAVDDDEISGDTFATLGSLTSFVAGKL